MEEDQETIVRNIGYYVSMKQLRKGIKSLSDQEKIFFLVYSFEMELLNGGADQYLVNSSGDNANEVQSAMCAINAFRSSAIIEDFLSMFPDGRVPRDRGERLQFLRSSWRSPEYEKRIEDITSEYYKDEDGIFSLLYAFFRKNQQYFDPLEYDVPLSLFECEFD
jgi:hypothetical protein